MNTLATPKKKLLMMIILLLACAFSNAPAGESNRLQYMGINLAGAEFNHGTFWPTTQEYDYFKSKGMNVFRIPFLWERMQPTLNQSFDQNQQNSLIASVNEATSDDNYAIIDPHNYARYNGQLIGSNSVTDADFADFWTRLANLFSNNPRVIFGLMNEPNSMSTEQWVSSANAAILAIRDAGAENLILVPGNAWTGAHSWEQNWYGTPNAQAMLNISDPNNNFAFELHQYFDADFSGTNTFCDPAHGSAQFVAVTNWLRQQGKKGLLGEFAGANNNNCEQSINSALQYLQDNADVWLGWTWWAAGPEWGEYIFTLEPTNNFTTDRPQMAWLEPFLANGLDEIIFIDSFEAGN